MRNVRFTPESHTNPPVFSPAGPKLLQDDCGLPNADADRADTNSDTKACSDQFTELL